MQSLYAPTPEFLHDYYSDAHTLRSSSGNALIPPGFDVEARLSPIQRLHKGGLILEIGAGDGTFCEILRREGFDAVGVDPLGGEETAVVVSGYASESYLGAESAGTILAYDVMEHAANPMEWLQSAISLLKANGLVILEVPDTKLWPVEAWHHEHFTQFTEETLRRLCERVGIETISCGVERPSRPHGITYVGHVTGTANPCESPAREKKAELIDGAQVLYARADRIRKHQEQAARETADQIYALISATRQACEVIIWGANEIASAIGRLLEDLCPDQLVRIVDNADSKIGVPHPGFRTPVQRPTFAPMPERQVIFVLCSRNWNEQITAQIEKMGLPAFVIIDGTNWPAE